MAITSFINQNFAIFATLRAQNDRPEIKRLLNKSNNIMNKYTCSRIFELEHSDGYPKYNPTQMHIKRSQIFSHGFFENKTNDDYYSSGQTLF